MSAFEKAHRKITRKRRNIPAFSKCRFSTMALERVVVMEWENEGHTLAAMYMPLTGEVVGPYVP